MSNIKAVVVAVAALSLLGLSLPASAETASNAESGAKNSNAHPMGGGMKKMHMKKHMMKHKTM